MRTDALHLLIDLSSPLKFMLPAWAEKAAPNASQCSGLPQDKGERARSTGKRNDQDRAGR
jgi:hypothetical protein